MKPPNLEVATCLQGYVARVSVEALTDQYSVQTGFKRLTQVT